MERLDPVVMRRVNSSTALRALWQDSSLTMAELAQISGLSRRTLEGIVATLVDQQWVSVAAPSASRAPAAGRPAKTYAFNADRGALIAVQLDVDAVEVLVCDLQGRKRSRTASAIPASLNREDRVRALLRCVDRALSSTKWGRSSVYAMTVATPGIVRDDGTVDLPLSIPEWTNLNLANLLRDEFNCTVRVENDAKLAAVGELWAGEHPASNAIWIRLDEDRIGVGIIIGGELYRGHDGAAGEIVWAKSLGFSAFRDHPLHALDKPDSPDFAAAVDLLDRARQGDEQAIAVIAQLAHALELGIATLAWILAPDTIYIGGSLGLAGDVLVPQIRLALRESTNLSEVEVRVSDLGADAILKGASKLCLDSLEFSLFTSERLEETSLAAFL